MKLKWQKNISLKKAWAEVSKKSKTKSKTKSRGEPTRSKNPAKKVKSKTRSPKRETKRTSKKDPTKKKRTSAGTVVVNGKERKVYIGSNGGKYYKSKGLKVYIK